MTNSKKPRGRPPVKKSVKIPADPIVAETPTDQKAAAPASAYRFKVFQPTDADRRVVEAMASIGAPLNLIRLFVKNPITGEKIDRLTLTRHFENEIEMGRAQAVQSVLRNLFRIANTQENSPTVLAAIDRFLKMVGGHFIEAGDENNVLGEAKVQPQPTTNVTVQVDARTAVAFSSDELYKLPIEDLRRLNEIRQRLTTAQQVIAPAVTS